MALRRRDAAIAGLIAFIAWTFVTEWFPVGRLLVYAFLAGSVAGIFGILWLTISTSRGSRFNAESNSGGGTRRVKTATFLKPAKLVEETERLRKRLEYAQIKIYAAASDHGKSENPISQKIDALLSNVQQDYVKTWHDRISRRSAFTNEVDLTIRTALLSILDRLSAIDVADVAISRFLPLLTAHVRDFSEAERIVRGEKLGGKVTESDEFDHAVASRYRNGKIHQAAVYSKTNNQGLQYQYLRKMVLRIFPYIFPSNMMTSSLVCVLVQEILAGAILLPFMQMLVEPDFWNQLIASQGAAFLQERKKVVKLRAALQEHSPSSLQAKGPSHYPKLSAKDSERKFDRFIRGLKLCNNLADARKLHNEISRQIQKEMQTEKPDQLYLHKLNSGRKLLDQKFETLSLTDSKQWTSKVQATSQSRGQLSNQSKITLKTILYDASGLSVFMEYMNRLNLMLLVQFYLVVDGFRAPSEEDLDNKTSPSTVKTWTDFDRLNMLQIYNSYLTKAELKLPTPLLHDVKRFLGAGFAASQSEYLSARQSILEAQSVIFYRLQDPHFLNFKTSDIFHKWVTLKDNSASPVPLNAKNHWGEDSKASSIEPQKAPMKFNAGPHHLRRSIASTSDLKGVLNASEKPRRSLDDRVRKPLFDDEYDSDQLANSIQSLDSANGSVQMHGSNQNVFETMQAELDHIVDSRPEIDLSSAKVDGGLAQDKLIPPQRGVFSRSHTMLPQERERPSIASLGLVGEPTRGTVFSDDLFGDEEKFVEDEREDSDVNGKSEEDEIHEADPGDLGLTEAISALTADLENLATQESIVDSLTNKATLTNNIAELRILRKSKTSLQREIRRKELQRQQYIVQESDNSLYGRATVSIQSVMVASNEDGEEYALYIIQVRRQNADQTSTANWVVPRRYSEFHNLNKRLKQKHPVVRNLDFPRRQVVLKLQREFLRKRRLVLEKYLQSLLLIPEICRSRELRAFLSQRAIMSPASTDKSGMSSSHTSSATSTINTRDFVSRIYNSVTDGMEEFLGNISVLDQLSLAGQNIISAATMQLNAGTSSSMAIAAKHDQPENALASTADMQAELRAIENQDHNVSTASTRAGSGKEPEPFIKPICDAFLELFDLDKGNNWLRGRAIVLVLHQLLGGTVERKVRETVRVFLAEEQVLKYMDMLESTLWPGGSSEQGGRGAREVRSLAEKARSKQEAGVIFSALVPEVVGSVVGRANAQVASQKFLAVLNNSRLNTHLAYTLLDEIVSMLFDKPVITRVK